MNKFHEDLANEQEMAAKDKLWESIYSSYFADYVGHRQVEEKEMQKQGVDRVVELENDKEVYIDEKIRDKDYGDALIEVYDVWGRKKTNTKSNGWILKPLKTDYISYFIKPSKEARIYDYQELKSVFNNYRQKLREEVKKDGKQSGRVQQAVAQNPGYLSFSICVEYNYLEELIAQNRKVQV